MTRFAHAMPRVSIVVPTYNRAATLRRAVDSVLKQTYQDFEVVVVDDGSTDETARVLGSVDDARVVRLRHAQNRGPGAARNTGIKSSRGEFIAFQDSDDEWLPQKLARQMSAIDRAPADIGAVYSRFWRQDGQSRIVMPRDFEAPLDGDIRRTLLRRNVVGTPVLMMRARCFSQAGLFDESLAMYEDWDLCLRVSRFYRFHFLEEPLAVAHRTPGSVNERPKLLRVAATKSIIQKHLDSFRSDPSALAEHYQYMGKALCLSGRVLTGAAYLAKTLYLRRFAERV